MSQLIQFLGYMKGGFFNRLQVNALISAFLILPCAFVAMLAVSVVQSRLNGLVQYDAEIIRLKYELEDERSKIDKNFNRISELQNWRTDRIDERNKLSMQSAWGDEDARKKASGEWVNFYHSLSSDNNLMIASMAGASMGALLTIVLTSIGSPLLACGSGVAIGMLAMSAAKGAKAFLISSTSAQVFSLDPYNILLLSFLAGSYNAHILDFIHSFIKSRTETYTKKSD